MSIEQGVWGDVWFWSGDFMPVGRGEICQIQREIYIYELTTLADVEQIEYTSFYSKINTKLLFTTVSDDTGFFELELTPGTYSLFVKEDGKYYSNLFTSSGMFPIVIKQGEVTEVRIDITYKATY